MNPDNNGNRSKEVKPEGPTALLEDQEPSLDVAAPSEPIKDATAPPTWATRVDALKTVATNRKPMVLLGVGLGAAVLLFIITSFFGKAPSKKGALVPQKNAPASATSTPKGSVTPLMDTVHNSVASDTAGQVTPADISRTKSSSGSQPLMPATQAAPTRSAASPAAGLASVPPFDSTQQHWEEPKPYGDQQTPVSASTALAQANLLKEASLVFVKKSEQPSSSASTKSGNSSDTATELGIPPGTRIQARLETQASSAVSVPVSAVVEYTYSIGNRLVIPAGAKFIGHITSADRNGYVDVTFDELDLNEDDKESVHAMGLDLNLGPIKGVVSGKNTGRNFLVRAGSGISSVAAMLVGNNTSGAFSEDDLIRQRIAANVGNAGDTEIMNMALTNRIVVSVPAGTPIYIVFTKRGEASGTAQKASSN